MYVFGIKRKTGVGAVTISSAFVCQPSSSNQDQIVSTPTALPLNQLVWFENNGVSLSNIGSVFMTSTDGSGGELAYDFYSKIYGTAGDGVLVASVDFASSVDSDNNFNAPLSPNVDLTTIDFSVVVASTLTAAQQKAITDNYTAEQQAIIYTLTTAQQLIFATGTASQKKAILITLPIDKQALFTSTPSQFIQTAEQIAADKLRYDQIVFKLKAGEFVSDDDSVFYALGNSLIADEAMLIIDNGGGFDDLRNAGLSQSQALAALSIYNVTLDTNKYESEVALKIINDDPIKLTQLQAYLSSLTPPLTLPPLTPYLAQVRANHAVYSAIKSWNGS